MADQRAELVIAVTQVDRAIREFTKFEKKWIEITKKMDVAADAVDFDVTSKEFKKLIKQAEAARKGMVRTSKEASAGFKTLQKDGRLVGQGFKDLKKDVDRVGLAAKKTETAMAKSNAKTKKGLDASARSAKKLQTGMTSLRSTVAGLGITFIFTQAIRAMASFEKTMDAVLAVTGATEEQFQRLNTVAVQLGESTIFSSTQVAQGMELMGRAGFKTNEIIAAMPGLLDLAAAGQLDLATATDIASNTLRGFGLEAEEITRVADVLAATAANSNTSVQALGDGLKFVAPVAASAGIALEEVAAAMGILSNAGLQGTLAGTGLRRVLSALAGGSSNVKKAMRSLGLTMEQVSPQTNTLTKIIETLASKSIDLTQAFQAFGQRGAPAILVLTSRVKDLKDLREQIELLDGAAKRMAETMQDNVAGAFRKVVSAMEGFVIKTGDRGISGILKNLLLAFALLFRAIDPLITAIQAGLTGAFAIFEVAVATVIDLVSELVRLLAIASDKVLGFGKVTKLLDRLTGFLQDGAEATRDFAESLGTDAVEGLKEAGAGFVALTGKAKKSLGELQVEITAGSQAIFDLAEEYKKAGKVSQETADEIVQGSQKILNSIRDLPEGAKSAYADLVNSLEEVRDSNREVAEATDLTIEAMAKQLARMAEVEKLQKSFVASTRGSKESLEDQTEAILSGVEVLKESGRITEETVQNVGNRVKDLIKEWEKFGEAAPAALQALAREFPALSAGAERVGTASRGAAEGIDALRGSTSALFDEVAARRETIDDLGSDIESLEETVERLTQKQELTGALSAEELGQLFNATDQLSDKQFEFGRAIESTTFAGENFVGTGERMTQVIRDQGAVAAGTVSELNELGSGFLNLFDALELVDKQKEEDIEGLLDSTGFSAFNEVLEGYVEVMQGAGGATSEAAIEIEKTSDGLFSMTNIAKDGAFQIDQLTKSVTNLTDQAGEDASEGAEQAALSLQKNAEGQFVLTNAIEETTEAGEDAIIIQSKLAKGQEKVADSSGAAAQGLEQVADATGRIDPNAGRGLQELGDGLEKTAKSGTEAAEGLKRTGDEAKSAKGGLEDMSASLVGIDEQLEGIASGGQAFGTLTDQINAATAACRAFQKCLSELG